MKYWNNPNGGPFQRQTWVNSSQLIETTCKCSSISSHFLRSCNFYRFWSRVSRESNIFPAYIAVFLMPRVMKKSSTLWSNMGNTPEMEVLRFDHRSKCGTILEAVEKSPQKQLWNELKRQGILGPQNHASSMVSPCLTILTHHVMEVSANGGTPWSLDGL